MLSVQTESGVSAEELLFWGAVPTFRRPVCEENVGEKKESGACADTGGGVSAISRWA